MGRGLARLTGVKCLYTNDGDRKSPDKPLLPLSFPVGSTVRSVALADTVTATGATADRALQAIRDSVRVDRFVYVTALITPIGVERLLDKYPNLTIVTAAVETRYEWRVRDGRESLFVHDVGDVGDLVSRP